MAEHTESQKTKTANQRRNQQFKEFSISVVTKQQFYHLVKLLNRNLGHGRENWYIAGHPLRRIQRYNSFNQTVINLKNSNNKFAKEMSTRPVVLNLYTKPNLESRMTKVFLEFENDKYCF